MVRQEVVVLRKKRVSRKPLKASIVREYLDQVASIDFLSLRRRARLSREGAAQVINVSPRTVYRWEHGKNSVYVEAKVRLLEYIETLE